MSLQPGQKLLHYEIVERIGEGGMGVVWKAHDTTLGRDVAIKVLPPALAQEPERLARFEREAKVLARLNHANIASVFGLHDAGEQKFLAMEYVAGEDLSKRLARGRLPLRDALSHARQVADALQSAHENGVVHRDLKPANVVLTPEGEIKVLDFGLAKAFESDTSVASHPSMSPTLTGHGTVAGVILGTAGYMSPEQARGHAADKRSDIFSFGVMLYEMLTGARAFEGDTVSDTLASILKLDPDWSLLPSDLPRGVLRLLERCLKKSPRDRLHDVADARIEIVEALAAHERGEAGVEPARSRAPRWVITAWAIAGALAGGAVAWALRPAVPEPPVRRFVVRADSVGKFPLDPRISPDGGKLVFLVDRRLHVHDLVRARTHPIEGTDDAEEPFWSPDGSQVGYIAGGRIWKVDAVGGGAPEVICDVKDAKDAAWNEAGTIGIVADRNLLVVPARGGEPRTAYELPTEEAVDFHGIDALPGGAGWVVIVHDPGGNNAVEILRGGERRRLMEHDTTLWAPRHAEPGYVLYHRQVKNRGIWAVSLSGGDPFLVAAGGWNPSASRDGTLAYRAGDTSIDAFELVRVERDGTVAEVYGQPQPSMQHPIFSPDGTQVLVTAKEDEEWDLWLHDIVRGTKMRLTTEDGQEGLARWRPGANEIYFHSPVGNSEARIYSVPAGGGEKPTERVQGVTVGFSSSGDRMVFARRGDEDNDLWTWELDGKSEPEPWLTGEGHQFRPVLSPDGKWIAYTSNESGKHEIYLRPFPSGAGRWKVSVDGGQRPAWTSDGKRLFYADWDSDEDALYEVDVSPDAGSPGLSAPRLFLDFMDRQTRVWRGFDLFPDGETVLMIRRVPDEDEDDDEQAMPGGVTVVQNWLAEFRD